MPSRKRAVNNRFKARIDLGFRNQALLHSIDQCWILAATCQIGSSLDSQCRSFRFGLHKLMPLLDVVNRTTVRNDVSIKTPFAAQDFVISFLLAQHGSPFVRL